MKYITFLYMFSLALGVSFVVPQRADALLLIIDHNSCWVNLVWGCGGDGGGGSGGGSGGGGGRLLILVWRHA